MKLAAAAWRQKWPVELLLTSAEEMLADIGESLYDMSTAEREHFLGDTLREAREHDPAAFPEPEQALGRGLPWQSPLAAAPAAADGKRDAAHQLIGLPNDTPLEFSRQHSRSQGGGRSTICLNADGSFSQTIESQVATLADDDAGGGSSPTRSRPWRQIKRGRFTTAPVHTNASSAGLLGGSLDVEFYASGVEMLHSPQGDAAGGGGGGSSALHSPGGSPGSSAEAAQLTQRWQGCMEGE